MIRIARSLVPLVVPCVLAACGSTPPSRFYALTPVAAAADGATSDLSVSLEPVSVPSLLDRPQIVTRLSEHEYLLAEFARWAEPLRDNVTSVVAENLSTLLGTDRVAIFGEGDVDMRVTVRIFRFDAEPGSATTLGAHWRVISHTGDTLANARTTYTAPLPSGDYEALAAAMSRTLADLARDVADSIRTHAGVPGT